MARLSHTEHADSTAEARLEALFRKHEAAVFAYARRRSTEEESDDVVAETFLVAWRRLDDVPPNALPWLLNVARKVLSTRRRSANRRASLVEKLTAERPVSAQDPMPDGAALEAFDRLSESDREALTLIAWEELTPREAAAVMGDSPVRFRVRLHRARRRLIRELEASRTFAAPSSQVAATRQGIVR